MDELFVYKSYISMKSKKPFTIKILSISLALVMVLSIITPFSLIGTASATENNTNDYATCSEKTIQNIILSSPGECAEEIQNTYTTTDYNNVENVYAYMYENNFLSTQTGADATPWASIDDGAFRYVHTVTTQYLTEDTQEWSLVAPENESKIEEVRLVHTWYKQVAGYENGEIVQVSESKIADEYIIKRDNLDDTEQQENKVYGVTTLGLSNEGELPASEKAFADAILTDLGTSLEEVKENAESPQSNTNSRVDRFLRGDFVSDGSNAQGSVIDYSVDSEDKKVSVFMGRFKDSTAANEIFELRSTPPTENINGDINKFNRLTSEDGTAEISGSENGLNVGLSAYQIPDAKIENGMTLVTQADKYPEAVNIKIVTRTGEVLDEGPITKSMSLNDDAIEYANENNALFVVLSSESYSETIQVSYMALVTNTDSATTHKEGETITSSLQLGQDDADTIEETQDEETIPESTNKEIAGAILNYDISTNTFSETVQYTGGYYDGDGEMEYLERKFPTIMELNGDITNYPHVVDNNDDTSATLTGNANGLEVMLGSDSVPIGRNHGVVMDYKVTSGDAPTVYLSTLSGHRLEIGPSNLTTNNQDTLVIDATKLSKYINNNGALFITIEGDSNTQMEVTCLSVIANVENPDSITCDGSTEDGGSQVDTTGQELDKNFEPNAKLDTSLTNLKTGQTLSLSAADSFDKDGQITEYKWKMNGQTKYGKDLTHSFSNAGDYEITLTVTDDFGETDTKTKTVSVTKDYVDKYTYEYKVYDTKYKTAKESPGPDWQQEEVVNREEYTVVVDTVEQANSPGSDWRKGEFSHTETRVVDTHYTTSTSDPGAGWEKVKKVGTVTRTNTEYTTTDFGETPSGGGWTHYDSSDCSTGGFFGGTITICSTWHWKKTTSYQVDEYQWKKEITDEFDIYEWEKTEQRVEKTYSWSKQVTDTKSGVTYGEYPTRDNLIENSVEQTSVSCEQLSDSKQSDLEACYPDN